MPNVTILPVGVTGEIAPGVTLLDAGEQAGVTMKSGCLDSTCGTCAVEVVEGTENLSPPGEAECQALARWGQDSRRFRLACCARVRQGRVVIRQLA
jgi:phenol hydroxylase P5 protein